jgi:hypothetical protein
LREYPGTGGYFWKKSRGKNLLQVYLEIKYWFILAFRACAVWVLATAAAEVDTSAKWCHKGETAVVPNLKNYLTCILLNYFYQQGCREPDLCCINVKGTVQWDYTLYIFSLINSSTDLWSPFKFCFQITDILYLWLSTDLQIIECRELQLPWII